MAAALAVAVGAAAAPPAAAPAQSAAGAGKASGDSFLEALGLDQQQTAIHPDAKAPPRGATAPKDAPDAVADDKPAAAAPGNPLLAWLVNLIGGDQPRAAERGGATADASSQAEAGDKLGAKSTSAPAVPIQSAAAPATPVQAASTDPAAPAANAGATAAALPPATAAAHEKTAAPATPGATADAPAAAAAPAAPAGPPPQLIVSNLQHGFAGLLAQTRDAAPTLAGAPHTELLQDPAAWPAALNEHVRWQLGEGVQEARLDLHPRELGSVQIQLRISPSGAEVQFAAAHPQARQALEQSLPQLRALLAADGLHLAQANVGSQSQSQAQAQPARSRFSLSGEDAPESSEPAASPRVRITRVGLVDDFA